MYERSDAASNLEKLREIRENTPGTAFSTKRRKGCHIHTWLDLRKVLNDWLGFRD